MIRIAEMLSLASFGGASLVANAAPASAPEWLFQFGALGLCAFMVLQTYRQQRDTNRVLNAKDSQIASIYQQVVELHTQRSADAEKLSRAMERLSEALQDRPCLKGDQRIHTSERKPT